MLARKPSRKNKLILLITLDIFKNLTDGIAERYSFVRAWFGISQSDEATPEINIVESKLKYLRSPHPCKQCKAHYVGCCLIFIGIKHLDQLSDLIRAQVFSGLVVQSWDLDLEIDRGH